MKFCLERGSSGRRARSWDRVLRSWPVDLIGGRRPCNTWCWLHTMAEKRASSASRQSSDSGGVDGDKNPTLWALVMTAWRRCLSDASVKPHQIGEAYSRRLISMACPTSRARYHWDPATSKHGEHKTFGHSGLLSFQCGVWRRAYRGQWSSARARDCLNWSRIRVLSSSSESWPLAAVINDCWVPIVY